MFLEKSYCKTIWQYVFLFYFGHSHCSLQRGYGTYFAPVALPETIETDDCFIMSAGPKSQECRREGDPFGCTNRRKKKNSTRQKSFLLWEFSLMRSVFFTMIIWHPGCLLALALSLPLDPFYFNWAICLESVFPLWQSSFSIYSSIRKKWKVWTKYKKESELFYYLIQF